MKTRSHLLLVGAMALLLILTACTSPGPRPRPSYSQPTVSRPEPDMSQGHQEWSYNRGIYEVNLRHFTEEGTFAAFAAHLDRLQQMGVGIIWFMPIHPIGQENRLGSLGSPYSVKDYLAVNPEYGTLDEFRSLVAEIHARDMRVIMDWVPNHTSWDSVLTESHPEWYRTDEEGNFIIPPGTNWSDVIQLDHSQPGLLEYMIEAMSFWAGDVGVDGFRFDAVSYVPGNFQIRLNNALKARYPDIFLLAEAEGDRFREYGYSGNFAWSFYGFEGGILPQVRSGQAGPQDLTAFYEQEHESYPDYYRMYFTDNHDENAWHGTTYERFGEAVDAFSVMVHTAGGIPLIHNGQEAALRDSLAFFEKDLIDWGSYEKQDFFATLLELRRTNQALWAGGSGGDFEPIAVSGDPDVLAYARRRDGDSVLVLVNLDGDSARVDVDDSSTYGDWQDVFSDATISLEQGFSVELPGWGYVVYAR